MGKRKFDDIHQDLQIVARDLPGKGPALSRLIRDAKVTHVAIANHLHCDRSAVGHWIVERKWPKPQRLMDLLTFLKIDTKLLTEAATLLLGGQGAREVLRGSGALSLLEVTADEVLDLIKGQDDILQRDILFKTFRPQAILKMSLAAAGMKGGENYNARAGQLFFDECRLHEKYMADRESTPRQVGGDGVARGWIENSLDSSKPRTTTEEEPRPQDPESAEAFSPTIADS